MTVAEQRPAPAEDELDDVTLSRAARGDQAAARRFFEHHHRSVHAFLWRMLAPHASRAVVEELTQDTFLRAFAALPRFQPTGTARASTWLLTIATRLALDAKKRATLTTVPIDAAANIGGAATPETERARAELRTSIERAAAALPEDQRVAFVLAEFHALSIAEIAAIVEAPEATVKTRLFRARTRLAASLGNLVEEP